MSDTSKTLERVVLKRDIGRNAPGLICDLAASGIIPALEELVTNAHDADAEHVTITYEPKTNTFTIEDDGTGMDAQDLTGFYRLGDSKKIEQPVTPKGRRCVGKFGIATVLLKYLCAEYDLETVKDGQRITIHEQLKRDLSSDQQIPYAVAHANGARQGTKLTLRDLTFKEGDERFTLNEFIRRLQWDMPIRPDFEITVNGTKIASKRIANAKEYNLTEEGKHMGHVHGTFYYTTRKTADAGVHIYVNGRRVGDTKTFLRGSKSWARVVGIVHADALERAILFDRGRFKEDDPGYRELTRVLKKFLGKMEYEVRQEHERKHARQAAEEAKDVLWQVKRLLNGKLGGTLKGRSLNLRLAAIEGSAPAEYDPTEGLIVLNSSYPPFKITSSFDTAAFRAATVDVIVDVLAAKLAGPKANVSQFLKRKHDLIREIYAQQGTTSTVAIGTEEPARTARTPALQAAPDDQPVEAVFSSIRMYKGPEILSISGMLEGTLTRLKESGAIPFNGEKAKGMDINDFLKRTQGYAALYALMYEVVQPTYLFVNYRGVTEKLSSAEKPIPFLLDVGKREPCFFVRTAFVEDVKNVLKGKDGARLSRRKLIDSMLNMAAEKYFPLHLLATNLGVSRGEAQDLVEFARKYGLPLPEQPDGEGIAYNYFYAATALDHKREGKLKAPARIGMLESDD